MRVHTSPKRKRGISTPYPLPSLTLQVGVFLAIAATCAAEEPPATTFDGHVKPFVTKYCVGCHGPTKQKGDRRFDNLSGEIADDNGLIDWQDVLDQLNLGEMPPPKEKLQPTAEERRQVIAWLSAKTDEYRRIRKPVAQETVLRRLNAREYRNTVRDLFGLNMAMFDPTLGFPRDQTTDHLDNVGESLVTSGHLLQRYLGAADRIIEKVLTPA